MEKMIAPSETTSLMYQDYTARRPMEIETFLGAPIKLAQEVGMQVPRIETLYALLHHANTANQNRPQQSVAPTPTPGPASPIGGAALPPRMSSAPPVRGPMNGMNGPMPGPRMMRPGSRAPSMSGGPPAPLRRGPPSMSQFPPRMMNGNGYGPRGPPQQMSRRGSFEGGDLEEFSHLMLYDNIPEGELAEHGYADGTPGPSGQISMAQREMMLRQREMTLAQQQQNMMRGNRRMPPPSASRAQFDDDDEDGEDFFDPMNGPPMPQIDPDNFDMMSVTSRRTRKAPSASQLRQNPELGQGRGRNFWGRPKPQNRTSARLMQDVPGLHDNLMNNPLLGYSSDRYGNVDRHNLNVESRTNSLTAERLNELTHGDGGFAGGYPPMGNRGAMPRRASQSPGNPMSPGGGRPGQRPSPPNGYFPQPPNGMQQNGRPSPPGMRAPVPRHPPGHGNAVAPQQVEQQVGVSNLYPPKSGPQVRSLTGSASASAGSGDSNRSAPIDSEPSAHSSSSSLGPRPPIGVR